MSDLEKSEPSRREHLLSMLQKEWPNYHPLISIARIAHHDSADLKLQFECHKTVAKYVEPELKSIEVKGEINGRHRVSVSLFGDSTGPVEVLPNNVHQIGHNVSARHLPGGAVIDVDPVVIDRVADSW